VFSNTDADATANSASFTACTKCGASFAQAYQMYPGVWTPNGESTFQWVQKKSNVVNQWVPAVSETDVEAFVNKAIMNTLSSYYVNYQSAQLQNGFSPMASILCGCSMPTGSGRTWVGTSSRSSRLTKWALATNACFAHVPKAISTCTFDKFGFLIGSQFCHRSTADSQVSNGIGSIIKTIISDILSIFSHKRSSVSGQISDSDSGKFGVVIGDSIQIELSGSQTTNLLGEVFPVFIENIPASFQSSVFDIAEVNADGSFRFLNLDVKYSNGQLTVLSNYPITSTATYTPIAYDGSLAADTTSRSGASRLVSGLASNLVAVLV